MKQRTIHSALTPRIDGSGRGLEGLAADVLRLAIKHMRRPASEVKDDDPEWKHDHAALIAQDSRKATLWLGSKAAAPWFDFCNLDQARVLRQIDWPTYGRALIKTGGLTREERIYVKTVCAHLEGRL